MKSLVLAMAVALFSMACGSEADETVAPPAKAGGVNPLELAWEKPAGVTPLSEMTTIDNVDLDRFLGDWYEIASIPAWFQAFCEAGVKANYTQRDDDKIRVTNSCYDANLSYRELIGVAAPRAATETSKLLVSFVGDEPTEFGANYWVLYLTEEYDLVLVGEPNRDYGWVLSRTPDFTQERLNEIAVEIDQFVLTDQSPNLE